MGDYQGATVSNHFFKMLYISTQSPLKFNIEGEKLICRTALIPAHSNIPIQIGEGTNCWIGLDFLDVDSYWLKKNYTFQKKGDILYNFEPHLKFEYFVNSIINNSSISHAEKAFRKLVNPNNFPINTIKMDSRILGYLIHTALTQNSSEKLKDAAAFCNMSASNFRHVFKDNTGLNYSNFRIAIKLKLFCKIFSQTGSLMRSAVGSGFYDMPHLIRTFQSYFGRSPGVDFIKTLELKFSDNVDDYLLDIPGPKSFLKSHLKKDVDF